MKKNQEKKWKENTNSLLSEIWYLFLSANFFAQTTDSIKPIIEIIILEDITCSAFSKSNWNGVSNPAKIYWPKKRRKKKNQYLK